MKIVITKLKRFLYLFFPIVENKLANHKIKKDIKDIEKDSENNKSNNQFIKEFVELRKKELEGFFNLSLEGKNILEDKAKGLTLIFTITISILLGMGAFLGKNINGGWYTFSGVIILSFYAVFNIIIASILILEILSSLNKVYHPSPADTKLGAKEKKVAIAFNTVLNDCYNLLRSNNLYTVYRSIMNTFVSLSLLFLFFIFSLNSENNKIGRMNSSLDSLRTEVESKIRILENKQEKVDSLLKGFERTKKELLKIEKD